VPGKGARLLPFRGERLGPAVCYEVVFPEEVSDLTRAGATILLTVTNDAWYGDTAAPWQHLAAARFRAAEQRRPLIRAAITGVSAMVRPDGSVASQIGVFQQGVIRGWVAGSTELSPFARCSWLVPLAASAVAALGLALAFARRLSRGAALRYPSDPTFDDDPGRRPGRGASRP
jgi:apolipoprotein N-acyltransferase